MKGSAPPNACIGRRRFLRIVGVHAAALAAGVSRGRASPRNGMEQVAWRGIAMGTEVSIQLFSADPDSARAVLDDCRDEILRLEYIFSLYDARSATGRLNARGAIENAPAEFLELLAVSRRFSELTDGAFDITVQPLCELLADASGPVGDEAIARALRLVGFRGILCDGDTVQFARGGMKVTFNGIAQGFVTDAIAEKLRWNGYEKTLVDLGEKRALGSRADGGPWRIGVESPVDRIQLVGVVELDNRALATSGGYGQQYKSSSRHHLLSARDGQSRDHFALVSVRAPTAVMADGLSTSLAVISPERAPELLRHFPEAEAFAVRQGDSSLSRIT